MPDSPIFARTYDLALWLVPRTLKFPRDHRFGLAQRIQSGLYDLQRALIAAALFEDERREREMLQQADVELSALRMSLRLSHDLKLLDDPGYRYVSTQLREVGNLLGGWKRSRSQRTGTDGHS